MKRLSQHPLIFFWKKPEMKRHEQKNAPEPHIPGFELNALCTHTHISHIFSTHRGARGVPRKRSLWSATAVAAAVVRGWFWRWQRGNRGDEAAGENGRYTHRSLPPPGYRRHDSPSLPHAKSPFVALDGKLLFVRRLRGEFSDDETRSFRTRYDSDSRHLWERVSYENTRGEPGSIICYKPV